VNQEKSDTGDISGNKLLKFSLKTEYRQTQVFSDQTISSIAYREPKTQKSNGIIKQQNQHFLNFKR
jgi:hypothetical protein